MDVDDENDVFSLEEMKEALRLIENEEQHASAVEEDSMSRSLETDLGLTDIDLEEMDISLEAIESDLELAQHQAQHQSDVEEVLSYLGRPMEGPFATSWENLFLNLHNIDKDLMVQLQEFSREIKVDTVTQDKFKRFTFREMGPRNSWRMEDPDIDIKWNAFVEELEKISNEVIIGATLTKPTGALSAPVTILWNYPSWSTNRFNSLWGEVLDESNPCVRMQYSKLGPSSLIKSQNRIPIRQHWTPQGTQWKQIYSNWDLILEKCLELNVWLNRKSKIIILVGKENVLLPRNKIVPMDHSMEIVRIELRQHQGRPRLFQKQPWFEVIRDRTTKKIHHLLFISFHTQSFFYNTHAWDIRVYHDLTWNAACGLAGIPVPRPMFFLRHALFNKFGNPYKRYSYLARAIMLRALEKQNGNIFSKSAVEAIFYRLLKKDPLLHLVPDKNKSFVGTILRYYIQKGTDTQSTDAWRKSPAGQKVFSTAIPNLLDPDTIQRRIATSRAQWTSGTRTGREETLAGLAKGSKRPKVRNAWPARVEALLRTKQARDFLSADPEQLTNYNRQCRSRLMTLKADTVKRQKSYLKTHVIWYSPFYPRGLRYEGDRCSEEDTFPYSDRDHPAVKLEGAWKTVERKRFERVRP